MIDNIKKIIIESTNNTKKELEDVFNFNSSFYNNPKRTIINIEPPENSYSILWNLEYIKNLGIGMLNVPTINEIEKYLIEEEGYAEDTIDDDALDLINEIDITDLKKILYDNKDYFLAVAKTSYGESFMVGKLDKLGRFVSGSTTAKSYKLPKDLTEKEKMKLTKKYNDMNRMQYYEYMKLKPWDKGSFQFKELTFDEILKENEQYFDEFILGYVSLI